MSIQQASYSVPRVDLGAAFWEHWANLNPNAYAGLSALPALFVGAESATYPKITKESTLELKELRRGENGAYARSSIVAEDGTYACVEYAEEIPLSDKTRNRYMVDFDAEEAVMRVLMGDVLRRIDYDISAKLWDATTSWASGTSELYTDVSSAPWDAAGSDAIGHIAAAREQVRLNTGMLPNTLILGEQVLNNLLKNTAILARLAGVQLATREALIAAMPGIFGLSKMIVGGTVYNSANEGQTFSGADMWGDDYAMVALCADPGASILTPSIGRTFIWRDDTPETLTVEEYREEQTRSNVMRVRINCDHKIVEPYYGHLLKVDA